MAWTDDEVERAIALWKDGRSASEIAKDLGPRFTRNAVLGKMQRVLGPAVHRSPASPPEGRPPRPKPPSEPRGPKQPPTPVVRLPVPAPEPKPLEPREPVYAVAVVPLLGACVLPERHQCKWPIGSPGSASFRFCNSKRALNAEGEERPYCETHCELAFQPPRKKTSHKELTRSLRRFI